MDNSDAGPFVWRNLTQAALDSAYDQAAYAANRETVLKRFAVNSEDCRNRLGPPQRFAYGTGESDATDVYMSPAPKAPINVFIHGGAWRAGTAADYGFPAELFVGAGACLAVPDFDWVQDRDGDLTPIADQVRRAIAWTWHNADHFGGDRDRLFLSAHSSGAHLAAVALTTDWEAEYGLPTDAIKSALLCSGIYDLEPVRLSARSSYVAFTDDSEAALSPIRHIARIVCPIILAHGTLETPEFQRQSQEFASALAAHGHDCTHIIGDALNHFEILETLAKPDGLLGHAVLEQMGLAKR